jgi:hypothetical protein
MTTERRCRDCGEPTAENEAATVLDEPILCDRCSAESAQSPDTPGDYGRRARWIAVAVGLAGAAAAFIGVTIARKPGGADQAWADDDHDLEDDDYEDDDFDGFEESCEECDGKVWVHYCPECHRSDD